MALNIPIFGQSQTPEAFSWGAGGAVTSKEKAKELREKSQRLYELLMQGGGAVDTSPVQHWTQGAARVANALFGAINRGQEYKNAKAYDAQAGEIDKVGMAKAASLTSPLNSFFGSPAPQGQMPAPQGVQPVSGDGLDIIRKAEGFINKPKWDVNAYRAGYGSDTVTMPDGTVQPIRQGMSVSREDAERDLQRRVSTEFMPKVQKAVGQDVFASLPDQAKSALASITYNYGSLPKSVAKAVRTPDRADDIAAIQALGSHNNGINRKRRYNEANIYGNAFSPTQVASLDQSIGAPQSGAINSMPPQLQAQAQQQAQPQQQVQSDPSNMPTAAQLMQIISDPSGYVPDEQKAAAKSMLDYMMKADPRLQDPLDRQTKQLQIQQMQGEMAKQPLEIQQLQQQVQFGATKEQRDAAAFELEQKIREANLGNVGKTGAINEFEYAQMHPTFKPSGTGDGQTADQQNYNFAIKQLKERGVPDNKLPTFQEWAKPKSRGISFTSPDGTQIQIGGEASDNGLQGTSIPAEVGARIGLGKDFLDRDYPEVIKMIEAGDATGPLDYAQGITGRGNSGIVQRRMATGIDALRRGLTGAGMSGQESSEYAKRYSPTLLDNAETLKLKAEGLKQDLEAVANGSIRGKAGDVSGLLPKPPAPDLSAMKGKWGLK